MKTTVEKVYVQELWSDGNIITRAYPIRTPDGRLMIERLKQLASSGKAQQHGGIQYDAHGDGHDGTHIFTQYKISRLGIDWRGSWSLLNEIIESRADLQNELFKLEGESELTRYIAPLPSDATNPEISATILDELGLRKKIQQRIRQLDQSKAKQAEAEQSKKDQLPISVPYTW